MNEMVLLHVSMRSQGHQLLGDWETFSHVTAWLKTDKILQQLYTLEVRGVIF